MIWKPPTIVGVDPPNFCVDGLRLRLSVRLSKDTQPTRNVDRLRAATHLELGYIAPENSLLDAIDSAGSVIDIGHGNDQENMRPICLQRAMKTAQIVQSIASLADENFATGREVSKEAFSEIAGLVSLADQHLFGTRFPYRNKSTIDEIIIVPASDEISSVPYVLKYFEIFAGVEVFQTRFQRVANMAYAAMIETKKAKRLGSASSLYAAELGTFTKAFELHHEIDVVKDIRVTPRPASR